LRVVNAVQTCLFVTCNAPKNKRRGTPAPNSPMLPRYHFPICTRSPFASGTGWAWGCNVCFARQLSNIPTCCTQLTVHRGAHPLCVANSRCLISAVYFTSGTPGEPRCCEH